MFLFKLWFMLGVLFVGTDSKFNRCYNCRSRTDLGDCGDPFSPFNISSNPAVNESPCSTGWCSKVIEGGIGTEMAATERSCLVRVPSDGQERCADVVLQNRQVFMCFCSGDLCNGSVKPGPGHGWSFVMLALVGFLNL